MAELRRLTPAIVAVHARPELLDALAPADAIVHRVAPDEVMVTASAGEAASLFATLERAVAGDPDAVVLDVADGWATWELRGADARLAFSRISPLRLPEAGTVQGDVLRVPGRVATSANEVVVFVPAGYGVWVERKILERCPEAAPAGAAP